MGGGNPAALQCNVTLCFSLTVMEGEGFVMKCGDSGKQNIILLFHSVAKFYHLPVLTNKLNGKKYV